MGELGQIAIHGDAEMTPELAAALRLVSMLNLTQHELVAIDRSEIELDDYKVVVRVADRAYFDLHRPSDKSKLNRPAEPHIIAKAVGMVCDMVNRQRLN